MRQKPKIVLKKNGPDYRVESITNAITINCVFSGSLDNKLRVGHILTEKEAETLLRANDVKVVQ